MDLKELIEQERKSKPPRILLHGVHKIGKSTWAAKAPKPLFICTEDGLAGIKKKYNIASLPLVQDWDTFHNYLKLVYKTLEEDPDQYKTIVIDTIDWLEKIIWKKVCDDNNVSNIDKIGYYKGYTFALEYWDTFFKAMDAFRDIGIITILLAHNEVKSMNLPDVDPYDTYCIKLHKYPKAKVEEWADVILFAKFEIFVNSEKKKAVGGEKRVIHASPKPSWSAGSRYDIPETLSMDINELFNAIKGEN